MPNSRAPLTITHRHGYFMVRADRKLGRLSVSKNGSTALKFQLECRDLIAARRALTGRFDISSLIGARIHAATGAGIRDIMLLPEAALPLAGLCDIAALIRRKVTTLRGRRRIAHHG